MEVKNKQANVFSTIEEAFEQDLKESDMTRQEFSAQMWPDRHISAAYDMLYNKLSIKRRPDFTIGEILRGCKIIGKSENTMRFVAAYLGYNMPTFSDESEDKIAEQEIKQIDSEMNELQLTIYKKMQRKNELEQKLKKVPQFNSHKFRGYDVGIVECGDLKIKGK